MIPRTSQRRPPKGGRRPRHIVLAALLIALSATTASAHGGKAESETDVQAVLDPLPAALDGVRVQLRHTLAPQLLVANPTDKSLRVLDADGRAFLEIADGQVKADLGAAAFHRSNTLMAPGTFDASAAGEPRWHVVEASPNWGWFDLRLRTDQVAVPHAVADAGERAPLSRWSIPVTYGDKTSAITGHFEFVPKPGGIPEARIVDAGALGGVALVRALTGSARAGLFVSYRGGEPLTVYGVADEPLLRFDANGVAANRHSPTWKDIAPQGAPDYRPGDGADWARVSSQRSYGWIEPRAGHTGPVEQTDEATILKRWRVPIRIGDRASAITGVTEWQPVEPLASAH